MSHARIEEVSDSDSDPSEGDIDNLSDDDFDERDILRTRAPPVSKSSTSKNVPPPSTSQSLIDPSLIPSHDAALPSAVDTKKYKDFQCIYPVYFDASRSRAEGRRVSKANAVQNPVAQEIVAACGMLRLQTLFEPAKCHPKDWANPGRIKVKVKGEKNPLVQSKHHLYILISKHLQEHPTSIESVMNFRVPGAPPPDTSKPYPVPAVPRGWKMGNILPYYSPAMSGGGVSENFFKDMMESMQGMAGGAGGAGVPQMPQMSIAEGPGGNGGNGGGEGKKKKEKRKIIRA